MQKTMHLWVFELVCVPEGVDDEDTICWTTTDPAGYRWWVLLEAGVYVCKTTLFGVISTVQEKPSIVVAKGFIKGQWACYQNKHRYILEES